MSWRDGFPFTRAAGRYCLRQDGRNTPAGACIAHSDHKIWNCWNVCRETTREERGREPESFGPQLSTGWRMAV